jgi:hypothetical protein
MQGTIPCLPVPLQLVQLFQPASREAVEKLPLQRWPRELRPHGWLRDSLR